jgi:hypothetical protein
MAEAKRDQNHITVAMGISSTDGTTPIMFAVDPVTNYLLLDVSADSLTATAATVDKRDQNFVPTVYGVSSVDGTTLVPIRTDTDGRLLVEFE